MKITSLQPIVLGLAALMTAAAPLAQAAQAPVPGQGTWETTLQGRDINGDSTIDAYYDTVLNVTWLKDANFAKTTSFPGADSLGRMNWADANAWAAGLDVYGVTGWQLPSVLDTGKSQLGHLYRTTLGNALFNDVTNTGPFVNWQIKSPDSAHSVYWYNVPPVIGLDGSNSLSGFTRSFKFVDLPSNHQGTCLRCGDDFSPQSTLGHAWAMHTGDVAPVPEPETYALMIIGLGALGVVARRKKRRAAA